MQPSFDLRIRTMNKALAEVVLPAIDPDNKAAAEQLQLVIGSLKLMQEQIDYANWFEIVDGRSMVAMAEKVAEVSGKPLGKELSDAIAATQDVGTRHNVTLSQIRDANYVLRETLCDAISQALAGADAETARAISRTVISMTEDQTSRERAYVAKTGFDVFPDTLKSIPDTLNAAPAG
jgi:hypothetical protein